MPVFDLRPPDARPARTFGDGDEEALLGVLCVSEGVESVRGARAFVRATLGAMGIAGATVDDAELIVSELVTNAVVHRGDGVGPDAMVKLIAIEAGLRIEVHDASPLVPVQRAESSGTEHGRGLVIVDGLADRWGWERTAAGKFVWCELAVLQEQTSTDRA